jgi:hypothetical protein
MPDQRGKRPMQQTLIAVDPDALDRLFSEITRLHKRLDAVQMTPTPEWLTIPEYAAHVGKTQRTIRNWKDEGSIQTKVEGKTTLVRVSQVA